MLLGKRPRLPIKRTTSMTGIRGDLVDVESEEPSDQINGGHHDPVAQNTMINSSAASVSPRNLRNQSPRDLLHPPPDHFLRTCRLCQRRLAPGRDIYMYRGDTAFCSSECREKQIKEDEGKEEYGGKKKDERHAASAAGGRGSRKSQTAAPVNQ